MIRPMRNRGGGVPLILAHSGAFWRMVYGRRRSVWRIVGGCPLYRAKIGALYGFLRRFHAERLQDYMNGIKNDSGAFWRIVGALRNVGQ